MYQDIAAISIFEPRMTVKDDSLDEVVYNLTENLDALGNPQKLNLVKSELAGINTALGYRAWVDPVAFPALENASYDTSILSREPSGGRKFTPLVLGTTGQVLKVNYNADGIEWGTDGGGGSNITNDTTWAAAGDIAYATADDTGTVLPAGTANQLLRINSSSLVPE